MESETNSILNTSQISTFYYEKNKNITEPWREQNKEHPRALLNFTNIQSNLLHLFFEGSTLPLTPQFLSTEGQPRPYPPHTPSCPNVHTTAQSQPVWSSVTQRALWDSRSPLVQAALSVAGATEAANVPRQPPPWWRVWLLAVPTHTVFVFVFGQ